MDYVAAFNLIEAGFWLICSVVAAVTGFRTRSGPHLYLITTITLIAFGVSDLVEIRTGAWWRPWWLLVWKGTCLVTLVGISIGWLLRPRNAESVHSSHMSDAC